MIQIDERKGRALARYAREAITEALGGPPANAPREDGFDVPAATFVTLRRGGELHGCVGALEARRPLVADVGENAVAAALRDPRAPVIHRSDVPSLDVEVSLLSPLEKIDYDGTEEGAARALVPFKDGVVLRRGYRRGTYLPQVWESFSSPREFLQSLMLNAGVYGPWTPDIELFRYSVRKWRDPAPRPS
ncbi:MAG: AmmeMemoRadiSam system protein A [Polyangiaceae bacterium]